MKKYIIPKYNFELFGDEQPRSEDEILLKIFRSYYTDFLESWSEKNEDDKNESNKFFMI